MNKKEVLIIFKTHLDIGFTDYAQNIVKKYLNEYIPTAIKIGNELKNSDTPFIWTVGSWLVNEALKHDDNGSVTKAIEDGILTWHALPFTTNTEFMNTALIERCLDISSKLDERFGKKTTAAKMTDVPGHCIGLVPYLYDRGISFLHLGVNPATPVPPVPPLFKWQVGDKYITVMYHDTYGDGAEFDDFVLYFAHTGDNLGPQSTDEIVKIYEDIQSRYPDYTVRAATLNDVAEKMADIKGLPIVEKDIGESWIHSAATDPEKASRFRAALKHIEANDTDVDLTDNLMVVPEHTGGMDVKVFFGNTTAYYHTEMDELKEERKVIERSWQEQLDYVIEAEKLLGIKPDYPTDEPDLSLYEETQIPDELCVEVSWQMFDNSDYDRYKKDYMRCFDDWAIWDFTKVGLPDYEGGIYVAKATKAYKRDSLTLLRLEFDSEAAKTYGLPYFYLEIDGNKLKLNWYDKKANRMPQACWVKFKGQKEDWLLHRLGLWIKPEDIVGSPLICAVNDGVKNGEVTIKPIDSPLVAPFGRRLLQYNCGEVEQDLYFNLYNNIWNTNFPMWFDKNAVFRFEIEK